MERNDEVSEGTRREQRLANRLRLATEHLEKAQRERLQAIVDAHEEGLSIRKIAAATSLSSSRVHQLMGSEQAHELRLGRDEPTAPLGSSPPQPRPATAPMTRPGKHKTMKVELWLRVEGNNKFVRGRKKARAEIEQFVLSRFGMEKPRADGWEYVLSIPYETDEELDAIVYEEILQEAERIAERRLCFTEADVTSLDDPERNW